MSLPWTPPPLLSLSIAAVLFHTKSPCKTSLQKFVWEAGLAGILYCFAPNSFVSWWRITKAVLSRWPYLLNNAPSCCVKGPLGFGFGKVCEVVAACLLWYLQHLDDDESFPIRLWTTSMLSGAVISTALLVLVVLSLITNYIMEIWFGSQDNQYTHEGVHAMADELQGKSLGYRQYLTIFTLAFVNAACEEMSSRGFWKHEFAKFTPYANWYQAAAFGWWHYHGIPSGWTGVALTFLYGLAMGWLQDHYGGLLFPILAHTMADFFIFSVVSFQQHKND